MTLNYLDSNSTRDLDVVNRFRFVKVPGISMGKGIRKLYGLYKLVSHREESTRGGRSSGTHL